MPNLLYKYILYPIYAFIRKNARLIVAIIFISLISYPVVNKVLEVSKNKPFFDPSAQSSRPLSTLKLNQLNLGLFDQGTEFKDRTDITFHHSFAAWENNTEQRELRKGMDQAFKLGRYPLITLEPWHVIGEKEDETIPKLLAGQYDSVITNVCKAINTYNEYTIINFAPEPDLGKTSRYNWALNSPEQYIEGYRRFVKECRKQSDNIIFMYSVNLAGDPNLYYPGDDYVDILGFASLKEIQKPLTKAEIDKENTDFIVGKLDKVKNINKMVYMMNFGIQAEPDIQLQWIKSTITKLQARQYPKIFGIIYLQSNSQEYSGKNALNNTKKDKSDYTIPNQYFKL
jgi:beta-mannanase